MIFINFAFNYYFDKISKFLNSKGYIADTASIIKDNFRRFFFNLATLFKHNLNYLLTSVAPLMHFGYLFLHNSKGLFSHLPISYHKLLACITV